MKKAIFGCLTALVLSFGFGTTRAQRAEDSTFDINTPGLQLDEIIDRLQANLPPDDTLEGGAAKGIGNFARFWKDRVVANDSSGYNMFQQYFRVGLTAAQARMSGSSCTQGAYAGNWVNIGPDRSPDHNVGRIYNVHVSTGKHPFIDTIIVSGSGGIWRSIDFGGHWNCISDNAPVARSIVSPRWISVNPNNVNHIYAGSATYHAKVGWPSGMQWINGSSANGGGYSYGNALLVTTNGGASWKQEILPFNNPPQWSDSVAAARPFFAPNGNRVYAVRDNAVFWKNGSGPWTNITPYSLLSGVFIWGELKFVPVSAGGALDPNHFFMVAQKLTSGVAQLLECKYTPTTGHVFTKITNIPVSNVSKMNICIPTDDMMYIVLDNTSIWRYKISTKTWKVISNTSVGNLGITEIMEAGLETSPVDPAIIYLAGTQGNSRAFFSKDTGKTFIAMSTYWGDNALGEPTHGDVRGMFVYPYSNPYNNFNGRSDMVFFATDGGLMWKPYYAEPPVTGDQTCKNMNGIGLTCGQFVGVGTSELNGAVIAGQDDDGMWSYDERLPTPWTQEQNGDGAESVASRTEVRGYSAQSTGTKARLLWEYAPSGVQSFTATNVSQDLTRDANWWLTPTWADPQGGVYVGETRMWRRLPNQPGNYDYISGGGLAPAFVSSDISLPRYNVAGKYPIIRAMALSHYFNTPPAPYVPTGYVLYDDGAIFYRNANASVTQFQNAFAKIKDYNFAPATTPNDITCDAGKPERVWVSIGSIYGSSASSATKRVFYSPNGGQNWFDVSKGLPSPLPVTHIVHQEGSPYLYASTDAGMYRLDMTKGIPQNMNDVMDIYNKVQWTCFNQGAPGQSDFPMSYVSDLEINYCQGKLYAATYGRGIWSTDIMNETAGYNPKMGDYVAEPRTIVSTNTTWNSDKYITSGVWIKNGATLTIQNNGSTQTVIHMPKNGAIVVDPGAKIIVNGARITNECGVFWKGILVTGNPNLPQTAANQGTAVITNGAVLEHARLAVANNPESVNPGNNGAGGIIYADNSFFRNNARSAGFGPYHNKPFPGSSLIAANVSRFVKCTFVIDDGTPGTTTGYRGEKLNYNFLSHVAMSDVEGVQFLGCTFANNNTQPNNRGIGYGITSWNAQYGVYPFCSANPIPLGGCPPQNQTRNTFTNFVAGINASGNNLNQYNAVTVDYASFTGNGVGVYANQAQNLNVYHSDFTIGNAFRNYLPTCECQTGVYTVSSHAFRIEENTFRSAQQVSYLSSNNSRIGVRVDESGPYNNDVYKNTFYSAPFYGYLHSGYHKGVNANTTTSTIDKNIIGLQYSCNTFGGTYGDVLSLTNVSNPSSTNPNAYPSAWQNKGGMRKWQGNPSTPTGNVYDLSSYPNALGTIVNNMGQGINYYYKAPYGVPVPSPGWWPPYGKVNPIQVAAARSCPSKFDPRLPDNRVPKVVFNEVKPLWASSVSLMNQRIDGGNTTALLQQVANTDANTAVILRDQLVSIAPYVSETVLRAVGTGNKLSAPQYTDVLMANPDVSSDADFITWLSQVTDNEDGNQITLDEGTLDGFRNNSNAYTDRTALQTEIVQFYDSMMTAGMEAINILKTDTTSIDLDTLCAYYEDMPVLWTQYASAWARLGNNTPEAANAVMAAIPIKFTLSPAEAEEYSSYKDLMDVLAPYVAAGKTELDLKADDLATVQSIANRAHGEASVTALTIYQKVTDSGALWTCADTSTVPSEQRRVIPTPLSNVTPDACSVYPNPAKDAVTFSYDLPEKEGKLTLSITSAAGITVFQAVLPDSKGIMRWDARGVASGTYLYQIERNAKVLVNGKLSIIK